MPTITPCLWFDPSSPQTSLEAAMEFYISVFPNSSVRELNRNTDSGELVSASFDLDGTRFRGINGGPQFLFSEAVSFQIDCADQADVDYYWDTLADGGEHSQCGWLKDRFGLSWQVTPTRLFELFDDPDQRRRRAAMDAMMTMQKIVIADLEAAADQAAANT